MKLTLILSSFRLLSLLSITSLCLTSLNANASIISEVEVIPDYQQEYIDLGYDVFDWTAICYDCALDVPVGTIPEDESLWETVGGAVVMSGYSSDSDFVFQSSNLIDVVYNGSTTLWNLEWQGEEFEQVSGSASSDLTAVSLSFQRHANFNVIYAGEEVWAENALISVDYQESGNWSFSISGGFIGGVPIVYDFGEAAEFSLVDSPATSVPEPPSLAIFSLSLFGLAFLRKRKHK